MHSSKLKIHCARTLAVYDQISEIDFFDQTKKTIKVHKIDGYKISFLSSFSDFTFMFVCCHYFPLFISEIRKSSNDGQIENRIFFSGVFYSRANVFLYTCITEITFCL